MDAIFRIPVTFVAASLMALVCSNVAQSAPGDSPPAEIVGFAKHGRKALLRRWQGPTAQLSLLGAKGEQPVEDQQARGLLRSFTFGRALQPRIARPKKRLSPRLFDPVRKNGAGPRFNRLVGSGWTVGITPKGKKLWVKRKGLQVEAWRLPKQRGQCRIQRLAAGRVSDDRRQIALFVDLSCEPASLPLLISSEALAKKMVRIGCSLKSRGRLHKADMAFANALRLMPTLPEAIYNRAAVAALRSKSAQAVRWLKQLKSSSRHGARRLFVSAKFGSDFRRIKNAAAFKALFKF